MVDAGEARRSGLRLVVVQRRRMRPDSEALPLAHHSPRCQQLEAHWHWQARGAGTGNCSAADSELRLVLARTDHDGPAGPGPGTACPGQCAATALAR